MMDNNFTFSKELLHWALERPGAVRLCLQRLGLRAGDASAPRRPSARSR